MVGACVVLLCLSCTALLLHIKRSKPILPLALQEAGHAHSNPSDKLMNRCLTVSCLLQHVRCVAAGGHHTVAVTDTTVCAWGSNSCGQLGTRTFMDKAAPTDIKELEGANVDNVACGAQHTLFLCR